MQGSQASRKDFEGTISTACMRNRLKLIEHFGDDLSECDVFFDSRRDTFACLTLSANCSYASPRSVKGDADTKTAGPPPMAYASAAPSEAMTILPGQTIVMQLTLAQLKKLIPLPANEANLRIQNIRYRVWTTNVERPVVIEISEFGVTILHGMNLLEFKKQLTKNNGLRTFLVLCKEEGVQVTVKSSSNESNVIDLLLEDAPTAGSGTIAVAASPSLINQSIGASNAAPTSILPPPTSTAIPFPNLFVDGSDQFKAAPTFALPPLEVMHGLCDGKSSDAKSFEADRTAFMEAFNIKEGELTEAEANKRRAALEPSSRAVKIWTAF